MIALDKIRASGGVVQPAKTEDIARLRQLFGALPADLVELWGVCDGFLLDSGVKVYGTQDMQNRNTAFVFEESASEYLLVGDNSGGLGLILHKHQKSPLYICDLGFLDFDDFEVLAEDFLQWVSEGGVIKK